MSEKYKLSPNCRSEAEYTINLNKPILPLIVQKGYKQGFITNFKIIFC